jgi:hypothetical protein
MTAAAVPNLLAAGFAACLAVGGAPASSALDFILSPIAESALRTVTPHPVPQIFIERPRDGARTPGPEGPLMHKASFGAPAPPPISPPASDIDIAVGAFLMVCKTLLLYLAAAMTFGAVRTLVSRATTCHAVTNLRIVSRRGRSSVSVPLRSIASVGLRNHPFGASVSVEVIGRRRPLLLAWLSPDSARAAERVLAATPDTGLAFQGGES